MKLTLKKFKKSASRLSQMINSSHSESLETLAKALGFNDFHHALKFLSDNGDKIDNSNEKNDLINANLARLLKIVEIMKKYRAQTHDDYVYMGEVIDPNWTLANEILLPFSHLSHFVNVGETLSGKTSAAQNFCVSLKLADPNTIFYFADGRRGGCEWNELAKYMSPMPVAIIDHRYSHDHLIQFGEMVTEVYNLMQSRIALYRDKKISHITQYRKTLDAAFPRVIFLIEDLSTFINIGMSFQNDVVIEGTIAFMLKSITSAGAAYGINVYITGQRYQNEDVPSRLRANITARLIHRSSHIDANGFLQIPDATNLNIGESYCTAQGLFNRFNGQCDFKVKSLYLNLEDNKVYDLLKKLPSPMYKKKEFTHNFKYKRSHYTIVKIAELMADLNISSSKLASMLGVSEDVIHDGYSKFSDKAPRFVRLFDVTQYLKAKELDSKKIIEVIEDGKISLGHHDDDDSLVQLIAYINSNPKDEGWKANVEMALASLG